METGFRIVTFVLLAITISISITFRHRARTKGSRLDTSQGGTLLVLLRLLGLAAFLPLLLYLVNPAWVGWARMSLPEWLRWTALGVAACMVPGIYWLFSALGNNISPRETTRADHALVTHGPYRFIRHPLYTFGGVFFLAVSVGVAIWWTLLLLTGAFVVLLLRTPREEAQLVARFGDEYRMYMARTGRYLPRFG